MDGLKQTLGNVVAWIGFAALLLGPAAAILKHSIGLFVFFASLWLFILTTNYVFWDRFRILPWK